MTLLANAYWSALSQAEVGGFYGLAYNDNKLGDGRFEKLQVFGNCRAVSAVDKWG